MADLPASFSDLLSREAEYCLPDDADLSQMSGEGSWFEKGHIQRDLYRVCIGFRVAPKGWDGDESKREFVARIVKEMTKENDQRDGNRLTA